MSSFNIVRIDDYVNTATQDFEYDALNRLTEAVGSYGTKTYSYDEIGNIITKDGLTYTYGEGSAGPHAVTSLSDNTTFSYDANGNMATKQKGSELTEYIYDSENQLIEVKVDSSSVATFAYDGDGGRVKKITSSGTIKYVGSLYEERGGTATSFIFLGDIRVASITGPDVRYYHQDHLGGTNVLTNDTGVKKELTEYEPFGTRSRHEMYGTGQEVAWFYFTGKELDDETGLIYFGARYYDPVLGRFIIADDIVQNPEINQQTFNRYTYTGNNPVNYVDPDGHFFGAIFAAITAIVKGAAIGAAVGAGVAAVTGGDIGQGALFGAIGGGLFSGFGHLAQGLTRLATVPGGIGPLTAGASFSADIIGGVLGGAAAGVAIASIAGADVGQSALIGGLSGGVFSAGRHIVSRISGWLKQDRASVSFSESVKNSSTEILKNSSKVDIINKLNSNRNIFDYVSLSEAFQRSQESIDLFAPISKVHWNRDWIYHVGSLFGALDVNKINNAVTLGPLVVATVGGAGAVASNAGFNWNPTSTLFQAFGAAEVAAATQLSEATVIATATYAVSIAGGAMLGILGGEIAALVSVNPGSPGTGVSNFRYSYGINNRFRY